MSSLFYIFYIYGIAKEMRFLSEHHVKEDFAPCAVFSYFREKTVVSACVGGVVSDGVNSFLSGNKYGSFVMESLADDDEFRLSEYFLGPYY